MSTSRLLLAVVGLFLASCVGKVGDSNPDPASAIDDSTVSMRSPADVEAKRREMIEFIWGQAGLPTDKLPASVEKGVASPLPFAASNLDRVDRLVFDLGQGVKNEAFHFVPRSSNGRLVIVHQGHATSLDSGGLAQTIGALVARGFGVLGAMMPCFNYSFPCPIDPAGDPHGALFQMEISPGSPLRFFFEHLVESLNYLRTRSADDGFSPYREFDMLGLSGGGWTTQVYAAIDPSITTSIPVSGGLPLYLRRCPEPSVSCFDGYEGDAEQDLAPFYRMAGYLDLYAMGASGAGRRQVQVQIRHDACCFGQEDYLRYSPVPGLSWDQAIRAYEQRLQDFLRSDRDEGWYRFEIDDTSEGQHVISPGTRAQVVLAELDGERRPFAASDAAAVYARGTDGMLWSGPSEWSPMPWSVVGSPAVVADNEVLLRDSSSNLVHLAAPNGAWEIDAWPGGVAFNPAAVRVGDRIDAVAVGADARLWHWWAEGGDAASEPIDGDTEVAGTPALVATGSGQLDAFVLRTDDGMQHLHSQSDGKWVSERVGDTEFRGQPTAIVTDDRSLRLLARAADDRLWEARRQNGTGPWEIGPVAGSETPPIISGSPSAIVGSTSHQAFVVARTPSGAVRFDLDGDESDWTFEAISKPVGEPPQGTASMTLSPVAVSSGLLVRGAEGNLWFESPLAGWSWNAGIVY